MNGVQRLFAIEARLDRAEAGINREDFDEHVIEDVRWLLVRANVMWSQLPADAQAQFRDGPDSYGVTTWDDLDLHVSRAEALEDLQHALIVGDEALRLEAERRMRTGMAADLSLGLNLLIEALTEKKDDWEERAWTFVEEMVPGEREHLTGKTST